MCTYTFAISLALLAASAAHAQFRIWEDGVTDETFSSGLDACNSIAASYNLPEDFDTLEPIDGSENSYWCLSDNFELSGLFYEAPVFQSCSGGFQLQGSRCVKSSPQQCEQGNPTGLRDGAKVQRVSDWVSRKTSRLSIRRTYRSDDLLLTGSDDGYAGTNFDSHAGLWRQAFNSAVHRVQFQGGGRPGVPAESFDGWAYTADDGLFLRFHVDTLAPEFGGHEMRLSQATENGEAVFVLSDGVDTRMIFAERFVSSGGFGPDAESYLLSRIEYSDGYAVTVNRDTTGRVSAVEDNRAQRMEFIWGTGGLSQFSGEVTERIEIDAQYDGANFTPDQAVDYVYSDNSVSPDMPLLTSATLVSLSDMTSELIESYSYTDDRQFTPPGLTEVYDGRLDDTGAPIKFAEYVYELNPQNVTARVATSSHAGNANSYGFARSDDTVTSTNSLGKETIYTYADVEGSQRVVQIDGVATANCLATTKLLSYTPNAGGAEGYIYERIERNGARTVYTRDSEGRILTLTEDADGLIPRVTTNTWDGTSFRKPLTVTNDTLSQAFTYSPDGLLLEIQATDVLPSSPSFGQVRTTTFTYTPLSSGLLVLTELDGPGDEADGIVDVATFTYNADGTMATSTDPNGLVTEYLAYDELGQLTRMRGPDGITWGMTYDRTGNMTALVRDPDGPSPAAMTYIYDAADLMVSMTDTNGNVWTFEYDDAKRLIATVSPEGDRSVYAYDAMGNVTLTEHSDGVNPATFLEAIAYDELGRILTTTRGEGQTWTYAHDVEDNLALQTDPLQKTTAQTYDALNRLVEAVDRAGFSTFRDHDVNDSVTSYIDPRAIETTFSYNGFGEIVGEISPDRGTISYGRDSRGLVTSMTDGRGIVTNYSYDDGGRLISRRFPASQAEDVTFTYDVVRANGANTFGVGRIGIVRDESGLTSTAWRDNATPSLELRRIEGQDYRVRYFFDDEGNRRWIEYPSGRRVWNVFDDDNRVERVHTRLQQIDPATGEYPPVDIITRGGRYEPSGPLERMVYGDGRVHVRVHDQSYRLRRMRDLLGPDILRDNVYAYTSRDDLSRIRNLLDPTQDELFRYEARGFLREADGPYSKIAYTYDPVGNRRRHVETDDLGTTTEDLFRYPASSNRLRDIQLSDGGIRDFTYDDAGNVIYDNRSGVGYGYTYNAAGRLTSFSIDGVVQAEYLYNAQGQQVVQRLVQTGETIHVIHDLEGNRVAEYLFDDQLGTSTLIREYLWMDRRIVGVVENGEIFYVRTDHIDRPVFATDATGAIVWEATYLPFGGVVTNSGAIDLRFPGQWFQAENGLHQNWMRDYDPTTGRYIQADPLGLIDGASVYAYALQNPMRYSDPRGEQTWGTDQRPFTSPTSLPFEYHERVWPGRDSYHDFPTTFDPEIWNNGYGCTPGRASGSGFSMNSSGPGLDWGYFECRCVDGALNGVQGRYEIGVRVPTIFDNPFGLFGGPNPTVVHRSFRPYSTLRP